MSRRDLLLETCEDRILCSAAPNVTLQAPTDTKIGDKVTVTATFDNATGTNPGYGPYIDLLVDKTGADGNDGLSFNDATYLGAAVKATMLTFDASGHAVHPYAKDSSGAALIITAPSGYGPGDQLIVLQLPFGSFTPSQPAAAVKVNFDLSNLADLNVPLNIMGRGGFQYGNDALDNPAADPSIVDPTFSTVAVNPTLFTLTKSYLGPEDETATGPNFLQQYQIDIDLAPGQTLTNLQLTDLLPANMQFFTDATHSVEVLRNGSAVTSTATSTPLTTTPGGTLTRTIDTVTGDATINPDATLRFWFYVPRVDASSAVVLNPSTGAFVTGENNASASGTWKPIDLNDPLVVVTQDPNGPEHTLTEKSIATQKTVQIVKDTGVAKLSPGDTLEYTIQVQISDYFAFDGLFLTDVISDGQHLDTTFTPTLSFNEHANTGATAAFGTANWTASQNYTGAVANGPIYTLDPAANDGTTTVTFRLSDELVTRGFNSNLVGGGIASETSGGPLTNQPPLTHGPTTATLTFRTVVLDRYTDIGGTSPQLSPRDVVTNAVSVTGTVLNATDLVSTGVQRTDTSGTSLAIAQPALVKSIYAINGVLVSGGGTQVILPGDRVTYRLQYSIPTGDIEGLTLTDFLPLPIFDTTTFDLTYDNAAGANATVPLANVAKRGPTDTYVTNSGNQPTITEPGGNAVQFNFGSFSNTANTTQTVDLLFTVVVNNQPFADGLFLTNQARSVEGFDRTGISDADAIVQVVLGEPSFLSLAKGVVGQNTTGTTLGGITFTAPGTAANFSGGPITDATQIDAIDANNATGVDAGDLVRFAIIAQNVGRSDAYDVTISDTLVPGYVRPATAAGLNLVVRRGNGALLTLGTDYTVTYDSTTGGFSVTLVDNYNQDQGTGSVNRGVTDAAGTKATDGSNAIVILYDAALSTSANAASVLTNTATLTSYTNVDGGTSFVTSTPKTGLATVTTRPPTVTKANITTETTDARGNGQFQAVIGETITTTVTITVPEGTLANAVLTDTLGSGVAFLGVDSIVSSAGVTYTGAPTVTPNGTGSSVTYNFGTITNTSSSNGTPETITITYRSVVLDIAANQAGTVVSNQGASLAYRSLDQPANTGTAMTAIAAAATQTVTVVEPTVLTAKAVTVNGAGNTGDAGDPVVYTITLTHGANSADAFDLDLSDLIPAGIVLTGNTATGFIVTDSAGLITKSAFTLVGNQLSTVTGGFDFANITGRTLTLTLTGVLANTVSAGQTIANTATTQWTTLDGAPGPRAASNANSVERTGAEGLLGSGLLNDYRTNATANIVILGDATKSIVTTSESSTTGTTVVPGEIIRYRLVSRVGEGQTINLQFQDLLPSGLTFLNDGTAKVAFVSNGAGMTSTTLSGAGLNQTGDETTVAGITPTFALTGAAISNSATAAGTTFNNGTPVYFKFGDVTVNDRDADSEFVVVEFNAIVSNATTGNSRAGNVNANSYSLALGATPVVVTTSNVVNVTVAEPNVTITKSLNGAAPTKAGDTVSYNIVLTNPGGANGARAFDVTLSDLLDNDIDMTTGTVTNNLGRGTSTITPSGTQTQISYVLPFLDVGESVTVTVTGKLKATTSAGETIGNTASVDWSSLPGSGTAGGTNTTGSVAGTAGGVGGERTGTGVSPNNYLGSATINVTLAKPTITKIGPATTSYTIGNQVVYYLNVTVPDGLTENLRINDLIPPGLRPIDYQIITNGSTVGAASNVTANFSGTGLTAGTTTITGSVDGQDINLSLGTITTPADAISTNNNFLIRVTAEVTDSAAAVAGATLTNGGQLIYRIPTNSATADPGTGTDDTLPTSNTNVTVVEPKLQITKSVNDPAPELGQRITFTITINHATGSGATAFDLILRDLTPSDLTLDLASVTATGATIAQNNSTAGQLNLSFDQLAQGGTITITYDAIVTTALARVGASIDNNARLYYDTLAEDDANAVLTNTADGTRDRDYGATNGVIEPATPGTDDPNQDTQNVTINAHSITGTVYRDSNASGGLNAGEPGIAGVTVTLSGTDLNGNSVSLSAMTNASGVYLITGVPQGTYTLTETPPAGFIDGAETAGVGYGGTVSAVLDVNTITNIVIPKATLTGTGYNFGETRPSSIAGTVYEDVNFNGAVNAGETRLAGVTVALTGNDRYGQAVSLSAITDGSGNYSFTNLRPGTYTLTETQPPGYLDGRETAGTGTTTAGTVVNNVDSNTITGIVLAENQTGVNNLFGEVLPASIAGNAYEDRNNNGVLNAGEPAIPGATIALTGTNDRGAAVSLSTTTAVDGTYSFAGLRPGTYILTETQPAGYLLGKNTVGTSAGTVSNTPPANSITAITLNSNATATGYNFGDLLPAALSGTVFRDDDNDGLKTAAEPGLAGVTITLTGTNDLGAVNLTTTTAADGTYAFGNLRPGTYTLTETQPAGFLDGQDRLGTTNGTLANDSASAIVLAEGVSGTGYTFGELAGSSLAGTVYVDANNNGLLETGETRLGGVTVNLSGTNDLGGTVTLATTTAGDGTYSFTNLRPGTYAITEVEPAGYRDGLNTVGTAGGQANNTPPSETISTIVLASNTPATGYNFGELRDSSVSGTVFRDDNNDGTKAAGEPGILGVTVTLTGTNDLGASVSLTTTTAANGTYTFANLRPGTYTVAESQPSGYLDGRDTVGSAGGTPSNDQFSGFTLTEGTVAAGYNFGELLPAGLSGVVYRDLNNDGLKGAAEPPIAGVAIQLVGTDDLGNSVSLNTTTAGDGTYAFVNLRPGTYALTETQPAGLLDGKDTPGTAGGTAAAPVADAITGIALVSGQSGTNYRFGELTPSSLGGIVYVDDNNNNVVNTGETRLANVLLTLSGTNDLGQTINLTQLTAADGSYAFAGLRPGTYQIVETQPAAYLDGQNAVGTAGGTTAAPPNDTIATIVLPSETTGTGYNFGELTGSSLGGRVYRDLNNDGVVAAGETGVAGVTVTLSGTNDLGAITPLTAVTDINGDYNFANLRPGTYTITETPPAGLLDGRETAGSGTTTAGTVVNNADSNTISGIALNTGQTGINNNFGELPPSSLAGTVYRDDNNNGAIDAGEPPIAGVTLTLSGTNDRGQSVTATATSNTSGGYAFTNLRPGSYVITETQPAGLVDGRDTAGSSGGTALNVPGDQISAITLVSSTDATGYNFGELTGSVVSGVVYNDRNNNGSQQAGEEGLAGVSVQITGTDAFGNAVNLVTTSAVDGSYSFAGLEPSNAAGYTLTETQPAGYLDGRETAGTAGGTVDNTTTSQTIGAVFLAPGQSSTGNLFGELLSSSLSGTVYVDLNNNGTIDGVSETRLGGVTVTLTGRDDRNALVSLTTTTAADGSYSFAGLRPSDLNGYNLTESQPSAYLDGLNSVGTQGGTTVNNPPGDVIITAPLASATNGTGNNFGELPPAGIFGLVYRDDNNNGTPQAGELPLTGVTVTLTGTNDLNQSVTMSAVTDGSGIYAFSNLRPGTYTLTETQPAGFLDGLDTPGNAGGTAAAVPGDTISGITLVAGQTGANYRFGELAPSSLAGTVYVDDNNNNVINAGETRLPNVLITLTGTNDLNQSVMLTQLTAADGTYAFTNLRPGTYQIAETQPTGFLDGQNNVGSIGGTTGAPPNDVIASIVLPSNTTGTADNFGELTPSSLSGRVYRDLDNNGVVGSGEAGLAGITVTLTGTNDLGAITPISVVTDANGDYSFANVRPGTYTITETQPAGLLDGRETAGTGTTTAGTVVNNAESNTISGIVLNTAQTGINNNFGELPPSSLSGTVYRDDNNNGVINAGEPPLSGVMLSLNGTDDRNQAVTATLVTGADGTYNFGNLRPGTYTITEAQPAGYVDGRDTPGTSGGTALNVPGDQISAITLVSNTDAAGYNFGELNPSGVAGTVYHDRNNNGAQDAGEEGLAGVSVRLSGTDAFGNAVNVVTTTGADGSYAFQNTEPSNAAGYTLTETQPAGYLDGRETAGTTGGVLDNTLDSQTISAIFLAPGGSSTGNLFGELLPSSLSGLVYRDLNNNGVNEGGAETPIAGVTVTLTGRDDRNAVVSLTTTTALDGSYSFAGLRPSDLSGYTLTESQPAGLLDGLNTVGSQGGTTVNNPPSDIIVTVPLAADVNGTGNNFGELPPAGLSGLVYRDDNNNGAPNTGEPGLAGVTITLTGTNDLNQSVTVTTVTDASGLYSFANLRPGSYTLTETQPTGYFDGIDTAGTAGGTAGAVLTDTITGITLAAGQSGTNYRFGELTPSNLAGTVYSDANNNGLVNTGEIRLPGVTVTLDGVDDLGATVTATQVTDASGNYVFANLRPGTYSIAETQPPVFLNGKNQIGTAGGTVATPYSDLIASIGLPSNTAATNYNFGELAPSSLSGSVYLDLNQNGTRDAGESAVPSVAIRLTGSNDLGQAIDVTVLTDGNGNYVFGDLRPSAGGYTLTETQPANYLDGPDKIGTEGGTAGNDALTTVAIVAGTNGTGNDFTERLSTQLGKTIIDTSLTSTIGSQVTIGETVHYRLTATVPFGTLRDFQIQEQLPPGLVFLNDGTASIALVSADGASLTASAFAGGGATGIGTPTTLLPDAAVSTSATANSDVYGSGTNVFFKLGDVSNTDGNAATLETIVIEFNARLADVPTNVSGATLPNQFSLRFDSTGDGVAENQPQAGVSPVATVTVVEPSLHITKAVDDATPDIGQVLNFTLTIDHTAASTADAFNIFVRDALPPGLSLDPASILVNGASLFANDSTASALALRLDTLALGQTITVTYQATVSNTTSTVGTGFVNNARIYWTTVPGDNANNTVLEGTPDGTNDRDYGARPGVIEAATPATPGDDDPAQDTVGGQVNASTITGFVYRDDAGTGAFAPADVRLGGVLLTLTGTSDSGLTITRTTTTVANGSYSFALLPSGSYTITETQPAGYVDGLETAGTAASTFGGTVSSTLGSNVITQIVVPPQVSTTETNYNFGETLNSSLAGAVYIDTDNNGLRGAGEVGVANVPVTLTGTDLYGQSVTLTVNTGATGAYLFDGLRPGSYTLTENDSSLEGVLIDGRDTPGNLGGTRTGAAPKYDALTGIALGQNQAGVSYNFGELRGSSLAGSVFIDANNDGLRDTGETGIAGVTVTLTGTNDLGQAITLTQTTAGDGTYQFAALRPGTYTLTETQPATFGDGADRAGSLGGVVGNDVISTIGVQAGQTGAGYTFGERLAGITGNVFTDRSEDGVRQAGEPGLANVTLTLLDAGNNPIATTVTDANGNYSFANVGAGDYTVAETQPAGYGISTSVTQAVTVPPGGTASANFGVTLSTLAGQVYIDADNSGTLNGGDTGLSGVMISLTGTAANGQSVTRTTTTASDGSYIFADLLGGNYTVAETQPNGFVTGTDAAGTSGGNVTPAGITNVALAGGVDATGYLFGETITLPPGRGAIVGVVYYDRNSNTTAESGEPGLAGVTLTLRNAQGLVVGSTVSGAAGVFSFTNLAPGTYAVTETQPAAYGSSTPNLVGNILVSANAVTTGADFGETTGSLGGSAYVDTNNNGVREAGEAGLPGVTVTLSGTDFNGGSVTRSVTTDANGNYTFTELLGGTYTVSETQPNGIADGRDAVGTAGGTLGNDFVSNIGLGGGINATGYQFGERPSGVSGTVFLDADRDGTRDPGETGLPGITLTLLDSQGNTVATTTTDATGAYAFTNILPGNYTVIEGQPLGYAPSTTTALAVTVPATGLAGQDFGQTLGSLSGRVYVDADNSGDFTPGESGLGGVVITLTGTDVNNQAVNRTVTTGADGQYLIDNLLGGNYTITETQPTGFNQGANTPGTAGGTPSATDQFSNIGFGPGVQATGYAFGETLNTPAGTGVIAGTVFVDRNRDGVLGNNEPGIFGATVELRDANGDPVTTTTTAADGSYSFSNLAPGTGYQVTEILPNIYGNSTPLTIAGVTVTADQAVTNQNFGDTLSTLSGTVYVDRDASGSFTGADRPLAGVSVRLQGQDLNGQAVDLTVSTAIDGTYSFTDLAAGTYTITETQPAQYGQGTNTPGTFGTGTQATDQFGEVGIPAGQIGTGYNFGETAQTITGVVYYDVSRDGTQQAGENGLSGVTVQLVNDQGQIIGTTLTGSDGTYSFGDLPAGDYTLVEIQPPAYGSSTPNTVGVTLGTGSPGTPVSFGEVFGSLTGVVYRDLNNSGQIDPGEMPISGVTLTLTGTDVNGHAVTAQTTTTSEGIYLFDQLPTGTYTITETQPVGFQQGRNTVGSAGGNNLTATDVISSIGLGAGAQESGYLFGERTGVDLVVTKDDGLSRVRPGQMITYTVTISNAALQQANGVVVTDQFPGRVLEFLSASNGGVYDPIAGTITWQVGQVAGGSQQVVTLTITARVRANVPAGVEGVLNGVSVTDDGSLGADLNPINNRAGDKDLIIAAPDLYVSKTDNLTSARVGDQLTYIITGGNAGRQTAAGVFIEDTLPAGLRFVSASNGGQLVGNVIRWNVGSLRPGQTFRFSVVVEVESTLSGQNVVNPVRIDDRYGSFEDPTPDNNKALDITGIENLPIVETGIPFRFDSFNNFARTDFLFWKKGADDTLQFGFYRNPTDNYRDAILPLAPIYSGEADPGSTLIIELYNANGDRIADQSVVVDSGGNWLASFPSANMRDYPASMRIVELPAPYSTSAQSGRNLRNYFAPVLNPGQFSMGGQDTTPLDPRASAPLLGTLNLTNPLDLGTVKYNTELLPNTGAPGGY